MIAWDSVNLPLAAVMVLPTSLSEEAGLKIDEIYAIIFRHPLKSLGLSEMLNYSNSLGGEALTRPVVLVPATKDYSFPKALALGFGVESLVDVDIDECGRVRDTGSEKALPDRSRWSHGADRSVPFLTDQ